MESSQRTIRFPQDDLLGGNQFHGGRQVADLLGRRGIAASRIPGVLGQRSPVGKAGLHGVADGMAHPGIRNPGHQVSLNVVPLGQETAAIFPDEFDVDALIAGGGMTGVDPEKSADLTGGFPLAFLLKSCLCRSRPLLRVREI